VIKVKDHKSNRLQKVKQILHSMDCEIELETDSGFWVSGGIWHLSLPDDEPNAVYFGIIPKAGGHLIAEAAIRFSVNATLMGLEVYPAGNIPADSTSPATAWVELINNK